MPNTHHHITKKSLKHVAIDVFFALLPLLVIGAYWPSHNEPHPSTFLHSPEWSMTACILYGLSISRFLFCLSKSSAIGSEGGLSVAAIIILPLVGIIFSVILISKTSLENDSTFIIASQFVNLILAILAFILLGGYGLSRAE